MENGDAERTSLAARAVDQDLLLWRNSTGFFNGDGEASASAAGDATDSSCNYAAWRALAMENAEGSGTPAARDAEPGPYLSPNDAGEGWQWSQ